MGGIPSIQLEIDKDLPHIQDLMKRIRDCSVRVFSTFSIFEILRLPKTCLSMGTGSALKDGGLQGNCLKAVLAAAVVFGRACGAPSTTFSDSSMTPK